MSALKPERLPTHLRGSRPRGKVKAYRYWTPIFNRYDEAKGGDGWESRDGS